MKELKTLKDLKHPKLKEEYLDRNKLVSIVELKAEAVKWIKELEKIYNNYISHGFEDKDALPCNEPLEFVNWDNEGGRDRTKPMIEFIKHFFNIVGEDLK